MPGILLVTGGSRGIGAAIVRLAAERGYAVAVNYQANADRAQALVAEIEGTGGRAMAVQGDVGDEASVAAIFAAVDDGLGPVTALVNNAGVAGGKTRVADLDGDTLRRLMDVNVMGSFYCAKQAIKRMSTQTGGPGGAIVNLTSAAVHLGAPGERVHYAASKGAIDAMTLGLGRELGVDGIRVNAVRPGLIDTDMNNAPDDPDRLARLGPSVPIGRVGTAKEVAEAVIWLLSDAASYVTSSVITVSGGR
ncbi:MAG: SDR family oxidoreductase [Alphaproteobacteria bacterium]